MLKKDNGHDYLLYIFHYKIKRANFGRPTSSFEDTKSQMIMSVEPDHQMDIILELKHSCILNGK